MLTERLHDSEVLVLFRERTQIQAPLLERLNQQIAAGGLRNRAGELAREKMDGGLVRADGKFLYLKFQESIYAIPLAPGRMLPPIPPSGFRSKEDVAELPGARLIPEEGAFPGPNPSIYAFTKVATHRNIYRVSVP